MGINTIQISPPQESRNTLPYPAITPEYRKCTPDHVVHNQCTQLVPFEFDADGHSKTTANWDEIFDKQGRRVFDKKPWYLHYQPASYKIGDTYGSKEKLKELITAAKKYSIRITVDVVLVHMRAPDTLDKADWTKYRGCHHQQNTILDEMTNQPAFTNFANIYEHLKKDMAHFQNKNESEISSADISETFYPFYNSKYDHNPAGPGGWLSGSLPSLRADNPTIMKLQKQYIDDLLELGVSGFRMDAAHYVPKETYEWMHEKIKDKKDFHLYSELFTNDRDYVSYWKGQRTNSAITAYHIFDDLKQSFSYKGSLANLPSLLQHLTPEDTIFTATHDTIHGSDYYAFEDQAHQTESNSASSTLALQFLIGLGKSSPLLMPQQIHSPQVQEALKFNNEIKKLGESHYKTVPVDWLDSYDGTHFDQYSFVGQRGENGFFALNKSEKKINFKILLNRSENLRGCFQRVTNPKLSIRVTGSQGNVTTECYLDGKHLPFDSCRLTEKSASFFTKVQDQNCSGAE